MKKICKCCGRNRRIGRFAKDSSTPDHKNYYCRECMAKFVKKSQSTPKGKAVLMKCIARYKKKNKQAIKEYNKAYYKKNRDRILYNKKCREETECILITDNPSKKDLSKINKSRKVHIIEINPKRKNG